MALNGPLLWLKGMSTGKLTRGCVGRGPSLHCRKSGFLLAYISAVCPNVFFLQPLLVSQATGPASKFGSALLRQKICIISMSHCYQRTVHRKNLKV